MRRRTEKFAFKFEDKTFVVVVDPLICMDRQDCSELFGPSRDRFAAMITENSHDESSVRFTRCMGLFGSTYKVNRCFCRSKKYG